MDMRIRLSRVPRASALLAKLSFMWCFVRTIIIFSAACIAAVDIHRALDLGSEFLGSGASGVIDVGLLLVAGSVVAWATGDRRSVLR